MLSLQEHTFGLVALFVGKGDYSPCGPFVLATSFVGKGKSNPRWSPVGFVLKDILTLPNHHLVSLPFCCRYMRCYPFWSTWSRYCLLWTKRLLHPDNLISLLAFVGTGESNSSKLPILTAVFVVKWVVKASEIPCLVAIFNGNVSVTLKKKSICHGKNNNLLFVWRKKFPQSPPPPLGITCSVWLLMCKLL